MSIVLQEVLAPEDVNRVREGLAGARWSAGKRTAGAAAREVKENLQADGGDARTQAAERLVLDALGCHPMFEIAARPARVSRILFSRYQPGMAYGAHTDDALMGPPGSRLRADLAFTLFLADPASYEGGALVIDTQLGEQEIKLQAGDAIVYSAGSIHRVAPVTVGERLAAVGWVHSYVPESARREILFDLSIVRTRLAAAGADRGELLRLDKSISNLLRLWARP